MELILFVALFIAGLYAGVYWPNLKLGILALVHIVEEFVKGTIESWKDRKKKDD